MAQPSSRRELAAEAGCTCWLRLSATHLPLHQGLQSVKMVVRSEDGVASPKVLLASNASERATTCSSGRLGDKAGRFHRIPGFPCKKRGIWRRVNARRSSGPIMKVQLLSALEPRPSHVRDGYYNNAILGRRCKG